MVSDPLARVIAAQSSLLDMPRSRNRLDAPSETEAIGVLRPISSARVSTKRRESVRHQNGSRCVSQDQA